MVIEMKKCEVRRLRMRKYNVAIVGATGAVGKQILCLLEQSTIQVNQLRLLASARSVGKKEMFKNEKTVIEETTETSFKDIDLTFFCASGTIKKNTNRQQEILEPLLLTIRAPLEWILMSL